MRMYNPAKHHRKSPRLPGYDYTQPGAYFITLNVQNGEHLFGQVMQDKMRLNEIGQIAAECWKNLPQHFSSVELDEFVIMPNHTHGIIRINKTTELEHVVVGGQHAVPRQLRVLPGSLGAIIRSYKSAVTKAANELRATPGGIIWQRDYYDHIVRDEISLHRIREYIVRNPMNWTRDIQNSGFEGERTKAIATQSTPAAS